VFDCAGTVQIDATATSVEIVHEWIRFILLEKRALQPA